MSWLHLGITLSGGSVVTVRHVSPIGQRVGAAGWTLVAKQRRTRPRQAASRFFSDPPCHSNRRFGSDSRSSEARLATSPASEFFAFRDGSAEASAPTPRGTLPSWLTSRRAGKTPVSYSSCPTTCSSKGCRASLLSFQDRVRKSRRSPRGGHEIRCSVTTGYHEQ